MGVRPSMGSVGDAYDNAMAERCFASMECELIDRRSWKTFADARLAIFTWIEAWCNPRRRHSGCGCAANAVLLCPWDQGKSRDQAHGAPRRVTLRDARVTLGL